MTFFIFAAMFMKKLRTNISNLSIVFIPILLIITCFAVSTVMSWRVVISVLKEQNADLAKVAAEKVFNDINNTLEKPILIGQSIANNQFIIDLIENENKYTKDEMERICKSFLIRYTEKFGLGSISLISDKTKNYYTQLGFNKVVDVENDDHDIWYKLFLDENVPYDFDIDVDEVKGGQWTIFLNNRIENENGLLGVCGVGFQMNDMQAKLLNLQNLYNISINLVDRNGLVQVDVDDINIENAVLDTIDYGDVYDEFQYSETRYGYTVTKYMKNLGWFLVIQRPDANARMVFNALLKDNITVMGLILVVILVGAFFFIMHSSAKVAAEAKKDTYSALAGVYDDMHIIDIKSNTFTMVKTMLSYNDILGHIGTKKLSQVYELIERVIDEKYIAAAKEFIDISTLDERLGRQNSITIEFVVKNIGWCRGKLIPLERIGPNLSKVIFAVENIDDEKRREQKLIKKSETDQLTGIKNRGSGEKFVEYLLRESGGGVFFLMDVDKFKSVNDTFGHNVGDEVIKAVANALKKAFREFDVVFRLGGDEFVAFASFVDSRSAGEKLISRFFRIIDDIKIDGMKGRKIHMSVGAVVCDGKEKMKFNDIYTLADRGLYESKKVEGNYCTFCE